MLHPSSVRRGDKNAHIKFVQNSWENRPSAIEPVGQNRAVRQPECALGSCVSTCERASLVNSFGKGFA